MRKELSIILFILFGGMTLPVHAAEETLHFDYIDTKGYAVFCVFRDADNIVWLGTSDGLITYAQLEGRVPFSYERHPQLSDIIRKIDQDNLGRLWLETQSMDILIYSPKTNELVPSTNDYLKKFGIYIDGFFAHKTDDQGRVWIGNNNKVYMRDFKAGRTQLFMLPKSAGRVVEIDVNEREALVVTSRQIYSISFSNNRVGKVAPTPAPCYYNTTYLCRDGNQNVFFSNGLNCFRYDRSKGQWANLDEVHPMVVDITAMPNGSVLIGSSNDGAYEYQKNGEMTKHLDATTAEQNGLHNSHIQHIYFDKAKDMVITTYHKRGMSLYSHQENRYQMHYIAVPATNYMKEDVISMTDAGDNTFWVGTEDNGIYHVSADASHQILENRYPGSAATMVFQDSKGRVWAGLYGKGLYASDGRIFFKGLSPFSMVEDKQGRLFVSLLGQGLWMVEPLTGKTASVYEGALWMMQLAYYEGKVYGISGEYLMAVDTRTLEMEQIPIELFGEDPSIAAGAKTLTIDHRGWLWMVSHRNHAEVHIYDIHKKKAYRVDQLARYVINGIVEDKTGDVWCTTDLGMVRVVVEGEATPSFQLYCYRGGNYGKMPYYNAKALIRLKDGRLLSGASEGYFLIDTNRMPDMLKQTITSESPLITSLRINDQEISPADSVRNISLHSDLIYAKDLVLSYNENNIVLECRPRGFHQLVSSLYYYQLEGESDQWMPMDNYIIRLSNLSPGKYKLKIRRQVYQQDEWEEFDMLSIRIRQPFWNTWQAWLGYLGVIIASFVTFLNFFRRRQKYNKKVREMEMQAERDKEMNDMKVRFFTNVSHDLRTPLTLIMTPVEELLNNEQPEPTRKVLEVVNRNAHHLFSLVNQILDFQRLGSTNDVLSLDNADIVELIKKECESYKLMAQQRHIQFNFHTSVDKLQMVLDADKIRKVINNLLSNSFKYTPDGGTICIDIAEGSDGMVQIKESDTGHGIPEADRDHVFERYYVSKARNVTMGSSGLGLNIVKHYVELHGGTVTASDNQPRGALFTILLPMTQKTAVAQSEPITPTGVEGQKERNDAEHRTARLLLVDDNADMLSYMSSVLSADYTIYQATNGLQALEIIRSTEVDLVVSDVMMDGMDGLELTRSIKRDVNISHVPIILLTAKGMAEDELKGLQMGANDYITKPFNFDVLRLRIRQQLEQGVEKRRKFRLNPDIEPSEITITTVDEQLLQQALDAVSKNMENPDFNVDQLASELGMHRTGLNRKLQAITGQTPLVFIRTLRLRRAHQILTADPAKMVSQVAYEVGFNNPKLFSKYFKEEYGCYPSELEASLTKNNL